MSKFSENFLLGAATAAHQVEGNNTNSDCWAQEQMIHSTYKEKSGIACDHYNRYAEDIKLMKEAGLNAYRFSIEWAKSSLRKAYSTASRLSTIGRSSAAAGKTASNRL